MTAEDIARTYTWNIIVNRWAATWIDFIILILLLVVPYKMLGNNFGNIVMLSLPVVFLYYPVLEGYYGYTIGKLACGIRVVDDDLNSPGLGKALIRTGFRLLEVNPLLFGGIPAGVLVLSSNTRQRLGDRLANTYVLRVKDIENALDSREQNEF